MNLYNPLLPLTCLKYFHVSTEFHNYHLKWLHWIPLNWFTGNCLTISLLSTHGCGVLQNACRLSEQKGQLCIWPSFCFWITLNSWANHWISPTSASSPGKHLQHKLVAISQRDDKCKIKLPCYRFFTITHNVTTPSCSQLFPSAGFFPQDEFPQDGL